MAQVKKKKKKQTEAQRLAHRDAVIAHADNKFVAELTEKMDAFIYTKDFYIALYKQLEKGMTAIEAYESLGFETMVLCQDLGQLKYLFFLMFMFQILFFKILWRFIFTM